MLLPRVRMDPWPQVPPACGLEPLVLILALRIRRSSPVIPLVPLVCRLPSPRSPHLKPLPTSHTSPRSLANATKASHLANVRRCHARQARHLVRRPLLGPVRCWIRISLLLGGFFRSFLVCFFIPLFVLDPPFVLLAFYSTPLPSDFELGRSFRPCARCRTFGRTSTSHFLSLPPTRSFLRVAYVSLRFGLDV